MGRRCWATPASRAPVGCPAVLAGLVLLFPQTILALARGDLSVAPPARPAGRTPRARGSTFRDATDDWISITVPFPDPARPDAERSPAASSISSPTSMPNLSRHDRASAPSAVALGGGDNRTDFELWLAWRSTATAGSTTSAAAGSCASSRGSARGFGYDGDWHGAFRRSSWRTSPIRRGPSDPVVATLGRELPGERSGSSYLGPPYDTRLIIQDLGLFLKVRENHPIVEIGAFVARLLRRC